MEEKNHMNEQQTQTVTNEDLMQVLRAINESRQHFDETIQHQVSAKDNLIDKLHADLRSNQKADSDRYILQVMKAVIRVRTEIQKQMQSDRWESLSAEQLREGYAYIMEDLTDLLENQGIISFVSKPGSDFDPSKQNPQIELTNDPSLEKP